MGLALHVTDLKVTSARGQPLLRVDDLHIEPGTVAVLAGPSGAGKSTFLHACAGLIPAASGTVQWGETEITALRDRDRAEFRRRHLGIVFQDALLFEEMDVLANAALPAAYAPKSQRPALRAEAARMLQRLGLRGRGSDAVPTLSGGERQRIAVARALISCAPVILADEPTAALDRRAADALAEDLVTLARDAGHTVLVASHDSGLHARADRLLHITDGVLQPC